MYIRVILTKYPNYKNFTSGVFGLVVDGISELYKIQPKFLALITLNGNASNSDSTLNSNKQAEVKRIRLHSVSQIFICVVILSGTIGFLSLLLFVRMEGWQCVVRNRII